MPLHLQYRPKNFKEFIGNKDMINSLRSVVERENDLPHAWLFIGPKGCGKTTLARIISENYLGCPIENNPDYKEINCGSHGKIDTVREIEKQAIYNPIQSKNRVWVMDEVHMLGSGGSSAKNPAQNALLKILEDAPKRGHLILCTTDPQRLIGTIHSRCHTFKVSLLFDKEMKTLINNVLKQEDIEDFPKEAIGTIIDAANGHPRDALKILDQVIDLEDDAIIGAVQRYETLEAQVIELCRGLLKKESWVRVSDSLKKLQKQGEEPEQVRRAVLNYITKIMLNNKPSKRNVRGEDITIRCMDIGDIFCKNVYDSGWAGIVLYCYQLTV